MLNRLFSFISRIPQLLWFLPLGWCMLIFWASARPAPEIPGPDIPFFDKFLHLGIYGILSLLWYLAIRSNGPARSFASASLAAFLLAVFYGLTDEYHQSLVDARTSDILDWAADTVGAAAVWLIPDRFRHRPFSRQT